MNYNPIESGLPILKPQQAERKFTEHSLTGEVMQLKTQVLELDQMLNTLGNLMRPVLSEETPPQPEKNSVARPPATSPLANQVRSIASCVKSECATVQRIIERMQLE